MIYVSGDTHGEIGRFCERNMPGESTWGEQDKLIICGDFGFVFAPEEYESAMRQERWKLDQLEKKPYQILFVSGNHENFDRLQRAEQVPLYGGTAFRIRSNIFLLRRGELYEIEGKKEDFCDGRRIQHGSLDAHPVSELVAAGTARQ